MKTFHFDYGQVDFSTLTVGELKQILAQYPNEMPCLATWEGIYTSIGRHTSGDQEPSIYTEVPDHDCWAPEDKVECLIFDVDQY